MIKTILKIFPFLFLSLSLFIIAGVGFFIVSTFAQESPIPNNWVYPGARLIDKQVLYEVCIKMYGPNVGCEDEKLWLGLSDNIGIGENFKVIYIKDFNPIYTRGKTPEEIKQVFTLEEADRISAWYLTFDETDPSKIADWYLITFPSLGFSYHGGLEKFPQEESKMKRLDFCKKTDAKCPNYKVGPLQITITPIIRVASYITIALPKDYLVGFADLSALPIQDEKAKQPLWVLPLFVISMILFIILILILGVIFYFWRKRKAKEVLTPPVQPPLTPGIGPGSQQQNN